MNNPVPFPYRFAPTRCAPSIGCAANPGSSASARGERSSCSICTGDRRRARRWSQAIYDAYPTIEGSVYPSKMHGGNTSFAAYERAATALPVTPVFNRALADDELAAMLKNAARALNYRLR